MKVKNLLDGSLRDDVVQRDDDGAFIPADPLNTDWQNYLAWLAAGNKPAVPDAARPTTPAT